MPKYVLLNLANSAGYKQSDLVTGTLNAQERKLQLRAAKNETIYEPGSGAVVSFDLYGLVRAFLAGTLHANNQDLLQIQANCLEAEKIFFATHGSDKKTDVCLIDLDDGISVETHQSVIRETILTYEQAARFMQILFGHSNAILVLVMCYAARSTEYALDHRGTLPQKAIESSFAFRLFGCLIEKTKILRMNAWTTMLNFRAETGNSVVQSEESYLAVLEQKHLVTVVKPTLESLYDLVKQQIETNEALALFEAQLKLLKQKKAVEGKEWLAIKQQADDLKAKTPTIDAVAPIFDYWMRQIRVLFIQTNLKTDPTHTKTGKFLYTFDTGTIKVFVRFPAGQEEPLQIYPAKLSTSLHAE